MAASPTATAKPNIRTEPAILTISILLPHLKEKHRMRRQGVTAHPAPSQWYGWPLKCA
jgi:hypothetical protein